MFEGTKKDSFAISERNWVYWVDFNKSGSEVFSHNLCDILAFKMYYKSSLGKDIVLTIERKDHILFYHPDLKLYFPKIKQVFLTPNEVRISKSDPNVLLFYKYFAKIQDGKYIVVVVKFNDRNFILTAYLTNHILSGEKYEP